MCRRGRKTKKGRNKERQKQKPEEEPRRKRVAVTRWIRELNESEGVLGV